MIHFVEMAQLSKKKTKLPVNLWIDESDLRSLKHKIPRIKFQNNTSDKLIQEDLIPISIEDNPIVLIKDFKPKISAKDLRAVKEYISRNKESILEYMKRIDVDTNYYYSMQK